MPADDTITADELAGPAEFDDARESDEADERLRTRRRRELAALASLAAVLALVIWWILTYTVIVPSVVGLDTGEALIRMTAADLKVGAVTKVNSSKYHNGEIAHQGPVAGQRALRGSNVELAIAQQVGATGDGEDAVDSAQNGDVAYGTTEWGAWEPRDTSQPEPRTYSTDYPGDVVPPVQALSEKKAVRALKAAGYKVTVKHGPNSSGPGKGKVFFQDPSPFSPEKPGTIVEIWVSTGGPDTGRTCPVPREAE